MTLQEIRANLASQLEEQERIGNDKSKERGFLLGKYRNLEHEVDLAREQLEKEKVLMQITIEEMNSYRDIAGHRCRPEEEEAQV